MLGNPFRKIDSSASFGRQVLFLAMASPFHSTLPGEQQPGNVVKTVGTTMVKPAKQIVDRFEDRGASSRSSISPGYNLGSSQQITRIAHNVDARAPFLAVPPPRGHRCARLREQLKNDCLKRRRVVNGQTRLGQPGRFSPWGMAEMLRVGEIGGELRC